MHMNGPGKPATEKLKLDYGNLDLLIYCFDFFASQQNIITFPAPVAPLSTSESLNSTKKNQNPVHKGI